MPTPSIEQRIDAIGRNIATIVANLRSLRYRFEHPAVAFVGPDPNAQQHINRIEREIGPVPLALRLFWARIGSVDLCGSHPDWQACDYPDPLVVAPVSLALWELDQFLADREARLKCDHPYNIPIAPDALHKADVSGGPAYNIAVPAVADDPPLNDEPHETTFLNYLELAISWGGFPGLEGSPGHTWPLDKIRRGL